MRRHAAALVALLLAAFASAPARAVLPDEILSDPALEHRARAISAELRCLVCQNQSIDDSEAPLARDLRLLVRERLKAGDSDAAVREFVVDRYGEFVLLRPPFDWATLILWLTPLVVLLAAGWVALRGAFRREPASASAATLSPEEEAKLASVLARDADESGKV